MRSLKEIKRHTADLENRVANLSKELKEASDESTKYALKEGIHFIQANINTLKWVLNNDK